METTHQFELKGHLTSEYVPEIKQQINQCLKLHSQVLVCLKQIEKSDLAGFNALVSLYISAKRQNKNLAYTNIYDTDIKKHISNTSLYDVFS